MAPLKRSRQAREDEDTEQEVLEVREASSSLRYSDSRKRARGSNGAPTKTPVVQREETPRTDSDEEDEDVEEDGRGSEGPHSPQRTQYEIDRDAGYLHLQNEELDDERATQKIRNRPVLLGDNHVAENGIIESITCINFMCHERLHCDLGPLINFIVGENGSGKSAVLTAITLCLGGKASSTNRGGNLKSFIKEGRDNSVLVVKIKNQGIDAYQPETYGESITIERHFSRSGGSGFRIKSALGRIMSTKKADVDEITEYWSLQVDNPLNVLSQDNAREFLNSSKPSIKYKYFVKGVQLEQLDIDYKLLSQTAENHEIQLRALVERTEQARKKYEEAKRLQESINQNQELKNKLIRFRHQLAWSQVAEQETILQRREADILELEQEIKEVEAEVEIRHRALELLDEELERAKQVAQDTLQDGQSLEKNVNDTDAAYQAAKKAAVDLHREEKDVFVRLKAARNEVKLYDEKIAAERELLGESSGPARKKLEDQLVETRRKEAELDQQQVQLAKNGPELASKTKAAAKDLSDIIRDEEAKRVELTTAESRLRELQNRTGSKFDGFEQNMSALLRRIDQDTSFEEKPVGPIGAYIQLLKPAWSSIIESFFGNTLNGFLVANKRDQKRLSILMQQADVRFSPIIIGKRLSPNVVLREPDPHFNTILRVLKFDNDWVRDQMIINQTIEKVILIEERTKAEATIGDGDVPRNVAMCLCFHDRKRGEGLRLSRKEDGSMSASPVKEFRHSPRMKSDTDSRIALQNEALSQLQGELRGIGAEKRLLQQALRKCEMDQKTERDRSKQIDQQLLKVQAASENIESELDQYEGATGRLTLLESQLTQAKDNEKHWGDQYGTMNLEKPKLNKRSEESKRILDEAKLQLKDFDAKVNKALGVVKRTEDLRRVALVEKNQAHETRDMTILKQERAEQKRDEQAHKVVEFTESAMGVSSRRVYIEEGETHQSIEQKYDTHMKMLKKRQQQAGFSEEEINDRAANATMAYNNAKAMLSTQQEEQMVTKVNLEYRKDMWRQFQRHISARTRVNFQYLLSERGFRGRLELDHPNKKLSCRVEPDETRKSSAGRSTKTLSGGEKSFSSICMLLAIWEAMGSPLRCLDEFDVFMDNVNRAMSTNMLITAARRSVSRQYILITPNAIEGRANLDRDVKIIRLTDPRQRTLV